MLLYGRGSKMSQCIYFNLSLMAYKVSQNDKNVNPPAEHVSSQFKADYGSGKGEQKKCLRFLLRVSPQLCQWLEL